MPTRSKPKRPHFPLKQYEDEAQKIVCQWLDLAGLLYCHPFNGGKRSRVEAARYTALGVKPGVPDLLIFDLPIDASSLTKMAEKGHLPAYHPFVNGGGTASSCSIKGVALELKASGGGRVSPNQATWQRELAERGWIVGCFAGSKAAIDWLESLYGKIGV